MDYEQVAAEGAGRCVAQATEGTLGCGAVHLVLRYVALELQLRVCGEGAPCTLKQGLVPLGGGSSRTIARAWSIGHSADRSFQMVHLRGMSTCMFDFGRLAQIRVSNTVHKADVALQEGGPREARAVLTAVPTSVDLLYCVMVVANVFAQAARVVEGLFTLPAWVPPQCPTVALFHVGHIALSIWNPLLALLAGPTSVPHPGPCFSPAVSIWPAPTARSQRAASSGYICSLGLSGSSRTRAVRRCVC